MPYKLERNSNGTYSVINKDTGRRLSKGTTKEKAERQIKAVYMHGGKTMKSSHRIRYTIAKLKDRPIKEKLHRGIVNFSKHLLKEEEMRGGYSFGDFWDDAWDITKDVLSFPSQLVNEVPYLKEGLEFAFPEIAPVLAIAPTIGKFIYGDDTNVWLSDMLSDMPLVGDIRSDKSYKTSNDLGKTSWWSGNKSDQQIADEEIRAEQLANYEENKRRDEERKAEEEIYGEYANQRYTDELASTLEYIDSITPQQSDTPYEPYAVPTYNPVRYDAEGNVIPMDDALRFPMVYNYVNTDQPKNLQDFLISNGVAGKNFSRREFGNVVKNQQPYAFLDFPLNGGGIRKISYAKTCA